jgi:paraquat-inducible protein A
MGGVIDLIQHGSWPIALVIFIASILVPIGKLLVLSWLCLTVNDAHQLSQMTRLKLYRITEFIGRWSMVDVFVVLILVALIYVGDLIFVTLGSAALAFASVVVLTMLAAITFDSRLIWDNPQSELRPMRGKKV